MYSADIARYMLNNKRGSCSPPILIERATKKSFGVGKIVGKAAKKEQISYDHLEFIIKGFIEPELCKRLPFVKWKGEVTQDVEWELDETAVASLSATLILSEWMMEQKWNNKVKQFYDKKFHHIFERFFTLRTIKENNGEGIEWYQAGGSVDGGVDSYGLLDNVVYVIQSKAAVTSAKWIRELFGTWSLISNSPKFRRKYTPELVSLAFPPNECNLILCTSRHVPFNQLHKKPDYQIPAVNFYLMGPWSFAWYIIENCDLEVLERRQWKQDDLDDLLVKLWSISSVD